MVSQVTTIGPATSHAKTAVNMCMNINSFIPCKDLTLSEVWDIRYHVTYIRAFVTNKTGAMTDKTASTPLNVDSIIQRLLEGGVIQSWGVGVGWGTH